MEEGGVRVPWIVRCPNHVPAGRVDTGSVPSSADWLPALCSLTDIKINSRDFVGEDAAAALLGKSTHLRIKPLLWKTSSTGNSTAIRDGQWKLTNPVRKTGGRMVLHDIVKGPAETTNLVARHPDVVKTLSAKISAWTATLPKEYIKADDGEE